MQASQNVLDFVKIAFGWLLGILSSVIVEWQKRHHRQKKLRAAIHAEMREFGFRMTWVAFSIRLNRGTADGDFLNWLEPIIKNYDGLERSPELDHIASNYKAMREVLLRNPGVTQPRRKNVGLAFKEFTLPLLTAHMSEISDLPVPFQSAVLKVKGHLDVFNQTVDFMDKQERRTFDSSITGANRDAVMTNLEQGFLDLEKRARVIADAISQIPA